MREIVGCRLWKCVIECTLLPLIKKHPLFVLSHMTKEILLSRFCSQYSQWIFSHSLLLCFSHFRVESFFHPSLSFRSVSFAFLSLYVIKMERKVYRVCERVENVKMQCLIFYDSIDMSDDESKLFSFFTDFYLSFSCFVMSTVIIFCSCALEIGFFVSRDYLIGIWLLSHWFFFCYVLQRKYNCKKEKNRFRKSKKNPLNSLFSSGGFLMIIFYSVGVSASWYVYGEMVLSNRYSISPLILFRNLSKD